MKVPVAVVLGVAILSGVCAAAEIAGKQELKEKKDKISYSIGYQAGGDFKRRGMEINPELFRQGLQDAMSGAEPQMARDEMSRTLAELRRVTAADQRKRAGEQAAKNLEEGKAFLAANAIKDGVVTRPSGLQYKVITKGTGPSPKATDNVTVHYRGTLINGTEFDSSYKRNKPHTFKLDRVIPGWKEALPLMKAGDKWQVFVPPNLAYGARGSGTRIGPNSVLVFEVELISVQSAP